MDNNIITSPIINKISTICNPQSNENYYCIDCHKHFEGVSAGKCSQTAIHTNNKCRGDLCNFHYIRAQQYHGKCDQCCWDEIT